MHRSAKLEWRELRILENGVSRDISYTGLIKESPVFVLSTGRSGTKFITKILNADPDLWVEHSPAPELAHQSYLIHRENPGVESIKLAFLHARMDAMNRAHAAGYRYVETNNRITFYAEAIAQIFPNAKFVHMVRSPAEFVRSGMRRGYYETMNSERSGHIEPRLCDSLTERWSGLTRVEKISWQWNTINENIEKFKRTVSADRLFFCRSDDLFRDPNVAKSLLDFVCVSGVNRERLLDRHSGVVNQQVKGAFSEYCDWCIQDKNDLKRWAKLATEYGFEL